MEIIKPFRWYNKEEIEDLADTLLIEVESKRRRRLPAFNLAEVIADYLDLGIVWEQISGDKEGEIAAMIIPTEREIIINSSIDESNEGFKQSTIAHEIGHWILHINHDAVHKFIDYREQGIDLTLKPFLCRSRQSSQKNEWQAQYFASCLLMPISKLKRVQKGRDLTNWKHLYAMADELGVSISNLKTRLIDLEWIMQLNSSKRLYLGSKGKLLMNESLQR
ncbi:ImmA/IrrE family metallo-endopeptidase [Crocosphaera sp. UHCC 0190]|uniref:ImmA/IrrE family metallo-endopeptidase n=1 Tax=Crocosphaera sp. UHCC 0190 TaxID=3110246 RepID=UPI002B218548|nr:ImmA/IrrE family metallo-endopeptidase [Crocosphaera sp. UHCC 0190]MEA5509055.1 ImmA/IrrE family metallo-endopeptidase [Crocosphaera sp. UHCC 0190]